MRPRCSGVREAPYEPRGFVGTIKAGSSVYALRHYYASRLIEKGKGDLGHSKIEITLNVYGHLLKGRDDAHKGTAEELATEILGNRRRSLSVDLRL